MQTCSIKRNYSSNYAVILHKSSSRTKHNWHCIISFRLMLLSWMFISSYTNIYFFVKRIFSQMFIFQWIRYWNVDVFWLRKGLSIKHVHNWWGNGGPSKMRTAAYRGRRCQASCVRTHLHYLFSSFGCIFVL